MKYLTALVVTAWLSLPALAVTPDAWKDISLSYQEQSRTFGEFLNVLSPALGVRTQVNFPGLLDKMQNKGPAISGTPIYLLDRLSTVHGFQWFVYRNTLYISDHKLERSENIFLQGVSPMQAKQALIGAGLFESKFGWSEFERGKRSSVFVSGPSAYVLLIKTFLSRISVEEEESEEPTIMIFPLRYASVSDIETPTRNGTLIIPGVASILKKLLEGPTSHLATNSTISNDKLRLARSLETLPVPSMSPPSPQPSMENPLNGNNLLTPKSNENAYQNLPTIEAYPTTNSIIIRDKSSKKSHYEKILSMLDVLPSRVEIVVTILDVDVDTLEEWVPKIRIANGGINLSSDPLGNINQQNTRNLNTEANYGESGNIVLVSTRGLSLALRNSVASGNARIQSRPSVMTLNNLAAVLDLSQTAYFKLLGERTADVKSVSVGTQLKVVPRILGKGNNADLHIQIEMQDGNLQQLNSAGELTQSRGSLIATQAIISPGQSLLIGGYRRDADQKTLSKIPVLSEIPVVGNLFKAETSSVKRLERLFVLSARVIGESIPSATEQFKNLENEKLLP